MVIENRPVNPPLLIFGKMEELPAQYLRGIELFNAGQFFESHEALEEIWAMSNGVEREFLSALIQSAAALHHFRLGNLKGASSVWRRAQNKLAALPRIILRLDTQDFAEQLERFFDQILSRQNRIPSFPTIQLQDKQ